MGSGKDACASVFSSWDPGVLPSATMQDNNIPSLKTGSPAIGKGATNDPFAYNIIVSGNNGTADILNKDMGAYTKDGYGNKHLPSAKPTI